MTPFNTAGLRPPLTAAGLALKQRPLLALAVKATGRSRSGLSTRMGAMHGRPPSSAASSGMPEGSAGSAVSCSWYLNSPSCRGGRQQEWSYWRGGQQE